MADVFQIAEMAKFAAQDALKLSTEIKNQALSEIAQILENNKEVILNANKKDLENAENSDISTSMLNRLKLDENKLRDMIAGVKDIAVLEDPVNKIYWSKDIADGITLKKISCPIGVIGVIFEARPDVISQIASLAIKSSNAVILKGGSEASETNNTIFNLIKTALSKVPGFPYNMVNLIHSREDVKEMLKMDEYIDLIIPRGSNSLVKYIKENTKIPVLGHADGICHIYVDEAANLEKACDIIIDAKCQYPAACNAVETVLVNDKIKREFIPLLFGKLKSNGVTINSDRIIEEDYTGFINEIVDDWHKEYGDKIISVKIVHDLDEAISHINRYGSGHTDCIVTENDDTADKFMTYVDSAGVYKNISTRFADGFRYGFGAEVGISTNKTHARGPVGLDGLTIYKYKLFGNGDIVSDFISGNRKFNK